MDVRSTLTTIYSRRLTYQVVVNWMHNIANGMVTNVHYWVYWSSDGKLQPIVKDLLLWWWCDIDMSR